MKQFKQKNKIESFQNLKRMRLTKGNEKQDNTNALQKY